ncbi:hypothetical protein L1D14_03915 [Vibrio tubiashii]|uniref:hypothetical protein n=1 Tax=Vibrio tubiashii TaxID=29498 RepID=UPI001EFE7EB3|nr:hypothetical protein [Vibrio tubiashii]MCG9575377.1 hypothetical protein [Vibrio tubiashii]
MNESRLPPVKSDLQEYERMAKPSDRVLIRLAGQKGLVMGCYIHGAQSWQADNIHGEIKVIEWWPLPENNTGTQL